MASCRLPVVLGIALISIGHILAFKSVNFESFPGAMVRKQKPNEPRVENKMKELQEQVKAAAKSENKTKEEVGTMKSKLEELTKTVEGSEEAVAKTMEQFKEISDRMVKSEARLATVGNIEDELQASKVSMNARITDLETSLSHVNELVDTKMELQESLKKAEQRIQSTTQGTTSVTADQCPSPFEFIKRTGQCLKVSDPSDKARGIASGSSKCAKFHKNGRLAILDTKEKQDGARKFFTDNDVGQSVLVGGYKEDGKYKWVNGEEMHMDGWCSGQPDGDLKCVSLWKGRGFCLDDIPCVRKMYLCEVVQEG